MTFNLGFGDSILDGSSVTHGHHSVSQFILHGRRLGFEARHVTIDFETGTVMHDRDYALMLHFGSVSLSLGYRSLEAPTQKLQGGYIGTSIRI